MNTRSRTLGMTAWLASALAPPLGAAPLEETVVLPAQPGEARSLRLLLRHQPPAGGSPGPAVLIVHGATFPSAVAGAYRLAGRSWMDELAAHGLDAWALDFAGYGGSERYPEMTGTAEGEPLGRAGEAARQIERAALEIARRRGVARVSIVAHSWGTVPAGLFAAAHPERVERLVLFGPIVARAARDAAAQPAPPYHDMTLEAQWESFGAGVPQGEPRPLSRAEFEAWGAAYLASDATSASRTPPSVRVPYGPIADALAAEAGEHAYDPGRIGAPTLVVRGDWDVVSTDADARALLASLRSAPERRYAVIPRGTHRMHLEASRFAFFAAVESFLFGVGDGE